MSNVNTVSGSTAQYANDAITDPRYGQMIEIRADSPTGQEPGTAEIPEQVIHRLDGVEFVVPDGFDSFADYLESFKATLSASVPPQAYSYNNGALPGGLEIGRILDPVPPTYSYNDGAPTGGVKHGWLKNYQDIQGFDEDFINNARSYFRRPDDDMSDYADDNSKFWEQVDAAHREYDQKMAAGEGIDSLTTKITLKDGLDVTYGDLIKIHEGLSDTVKDINDYYVESGAQDYESFVIYGVSTSDVKQYMEKELSSPELAQKVTDQYEWRNEMMFKIDQKRVEPLEYGQVREDWYYYSKRNYDVHDTRTLAGSAYQTFSHLDTSSEQTLKSSFDKATEWYVEQMQKYYDISPYTNQQKAQGINYVNGFISQIKSYFIS